MLWPWRAGGHPGTCRTGTLSPPVLYQIMITFFPYNCSLNNMSFSKVYGTLTWTESGDSNVVPLFAHLLAPSLQQPGHGVLCRGVEPGQENMLLIRIKLWHCLYLYVGSNVVFLFTRTILVHAYRYY